MAHNLTVNNSQTVASQDSGVAVALLPECGFHVTLEKDNTNVSLHLSEEAGALGFIFCRYEDKLV